MKIWNIVVSLAVVGLGLTAWRQGDWAGSDEARRGGGHSQGFAQFGCYSIAIGLFGVAVWVLFLKGKDFLAARDALIREAVPIKPEVTRVGLEYNKLFE